MAFPKALLVLALVACGQLASLALARSLGSGGTAACGSPGLLQSLLANKGEKVVGYKVHNDVVRRELLHTNCSKLSIGLTDRWMMQWDLQNNMYELNFTNNCAYDLIGLASFSNCVNFNNLGPGLENPGTNWCQQGPTFAPITMHHGGYEYGNAVCGLFMNQGDCEAEKHVQIYAGQRVTVYYLDQHAHYVCTWNLTFADNPDTPILDDPVLPWSEHNCALHSTQ